MKSKKKGKRKKGVRGGEEGKKRRNEKT